MDKYLVKPTEIIGENGTVRGYSNVQKDIDLKIDAYLETVGQILETHTNKLEQLNLNDSDNPTTGSGESNCICVNNSYSYTEVKDDLTFQVGIGLLEHCMETNSNSLATLADKMSNLSNTVETEYVNLETYKATYQVKSSTNDNELLTSTRVTTRIDIIGDVNGTSINNIATAVNNLNTKINLVDGSVQAYAEIIESNKSRITALEENQTPTDLTELQSDVSLLKTAVQNHNTKITTLESKDCLTRELTVKPYENYTQDQCDKWGVDKNASITLPADEMIQGAFMLVAANQADVNLMNETITSHTNSIQSLDTRTGSHTATIGSLETRMTDVETLCNGNKSNINSAFSRIESLEDQVAAGTGTSYIGEININEDGSDVEFTHNGDVYSGANLITVFERLKYLIQDIDDRLNELEHKTENL